MERNTRKTLTSVVTSTKNSKTIAVLVSTYKRHPLYNKRFIYSKTYQVHDENEVAKVGDKVEIMETRPLSATKHFRLVKVVEEAKA
jgi:small subunit ribosomal protein S17